MKQAAQARRLLWLEHGGYAARLLAGGEAPWRDVAATLAWMRQAQGLLRSDVVTLPAGEVARALLAQAPGAPAASASSSLRQAMADKAARPAGPLRVWLADTALRDHVAALLAGLRAALPGTLIALAVPAPRQWLRLAAAAAGVAGEGQGEVDEADEDSLDAAASYSADFLRHFASGIDAVLLQEDRPWPDADSAALCLELYQPVANVAAHYGWSYGLQLPEAIALPGGHPPGFVIAPAPLEGVLSGVAVPAGIWQGELLPAAPAGAFDHATIPPAAEPESVLAARGCARGAGHGERRPVAVESSRGAGARLQPAALHGLAR